MADLGNLTSVVIVLLFFVITILGGAFLWILNYHFKKFSLPNDKHGKLFVCIYTICWLILTLVGLYIIYV